MGDNLKVSIRSAGRYHYSPRLLEFSCNTSPEESSCAGTTDGRKILSRSNVVVRNEWYRMGCLTQVSEEVTPRSMFRTPRVERCLSAVQHERGRVLDATRKLPDATVDLTSESQSTYRWSSRD